MPQPFRFGVFAERAISRQLLLDTARKSEDDGFSTILIRDHFIAEPFGHQLAPIAALAAVAGVTKHLRIGSLVFCNDYRHPVLLAKEAATLDVISEGRFELGLGAGFSQAEYEQAGIPFERAALRVERLAESIQIVKGLWTGRPFTFSGKYYSIDQLQSFPEPVQRPHPPLLVAGSGKRMLAIASEQANIVGLQTVATVSGASVQAPEQRAADTVAQKVQQLREQAGNRFSQLELSTTISVIITDHPIDAASQFGRTRGWHGASPEQILEMPSVFIGTVGSIVEQMQARRERYGLSYFVIHDHGMQTLAPVVAQLSGK